MASVSVVIPTWNRAGLVVEAVDSALAQTVEVSEVLVCDDGSTDDTRHRILSLADPRVRFIDGPRAGRPAVPRNRGINAASGEWIAFLDSDDTWLPDKLARQLEAMRQAATLAGSTNAWRILPRQGRISPYLPPSTLTRLTLGKLLKTNLIICSSAVVHRSILDKTGGFPEDRLLTAIEDYGLWLRVAAFTDFCYLSEPLVRYRDEPDASLRANTRERPLREGVMLNYYSWARRHPLPSGQLRAIRKETRRAMRKNGRSIFARIALGWDRG